MKNSIYQHITTKGMSIGEPGSNHRGWKEARGESFSLLLAMQQRSQEGAEHTWTPELQKPSSDLPERIVHPNSAVQTHPDNSKQAEFSQLKKAGSLDVLSAQSELPGYMSVDDNEVPQQIDSGNADTSLAEPNVLKSNLLDENEKQLERMHRDNGAGNQHTRSSPDLMSNARIPFRTDRVQDPGAGIPNLESQVPSLRETDFPEKQAENVAWHGLQNPVPPFRPVQRPTAYKSPQKDTQPHGSDHRRSTARRYIKVLSRIDADSPVKGDHRQPVLGSAKISEVLLPSNPDDATSNIPSAMPQNWELQGYLLDVCPEMLTPCNSDTGRITDSPKYTTGPATDPPNDQRSQPRRDGQVPSYESRRSHIPRSTRSSSKGLMPSSPVVIQHIGGDGYRHPDVPDRVNQERMPVESSNIETPLANVHLDQQQESIPPFSPLRSSRLQMPEPSNSQHSHNSYSTSSQEEVSRSDEAGPLQPIRHAVLNGSGQIITDHRPREEAAETLYPRSTPYNRRISDVSHEAIITEKRGGTSSINVPPDSRIEIGEREISTRPLTASLSQTGAGQARPERSQRNTVDRGRTPPVTGTDVKESSGLLNPEPESKAIPVVSEIPLVDSDDMSHSSEGTRKLSPHIRLVSDAGAPAEPRFEETQTIPQTQLRSMQQQIAYPSEDHNVSLEGNSRDIRESALEIRGNPQTNPAPEARMLLHKGDVDLSYAPIREEASPPNVSVARDVQRDNEIYQRQERPQVVYTDRNLSEQRQARRSKTTSGNIKPPQENPDTGILQTRPTKHDNPHSPGVNVIAPFDTKTNSPGQIKQTESGMRGTQKQSRTVYAPNDVKPARGPQLADPAGQRDISGLQRKSSEVSVPHADILIQEEPPDGIGMLDNPERSQVNVTPQASYPSQIKDSDIPYSPRPEVPEQSGLLSKAQRDISSPADQNAPARQDIRTIGELSVSDAVIHPQEKSPDSVAAPARLETQPERSQTEHARHDALDNIGKPLRDQPVGHTSSDDTDLQNVIKTNEIPISGISEDTQSPVSSETQPRVTVDQSEYSGSQIRDMQNTTPEHLREQLNHGTDLLSMVRTSETSVPDTSGNRPSHASSETEPPAAMDQMEHLRQDSNPPEPRNEYVSDIPQQQDVNRTGGTVIPNAVAPLIKYPERGLSKKGNAEKPTLTVSAPVEESLSKTWNTVIPDPVLLNPREETSRQDDILPSLRSAEDKPDSIQTSERQDAMAVQEPFSANILHGKLDQRFATSGKSTDGLNVEDDRNILSDIIPRVPLDDKDTSDEGEHEWGKRALPDVPEQIRHPDVPVFREFKTAISESMIPDLELKIEDWPVKEDPQMVSSLPELPDRISMHVDNMATTGGTSTISIQLEPKHLGKIRFRVSLKENKVSANLYVDRAETKEIIELQLPDIRRALVEHQVEVTELNISLGSGSTESDLRHSGPFRDNGGMDKPATYQREEGEENTGGRMQDSLPQRYARADVLVDIFV